ncbi:MAG: hypothetical protein ACXVCY_16505 [Pseudobdellovibrionaceae bacterium]
MKKEAIIAVLSLVPILGMAKVPDFNSLISENTKAQNELHSTVRHSIENSRDEVTAEKMRERIVIVEDSGQSYNAPTKRNLLVYKKERAQHRASEQKQFDRLANEIRSQNE